MGEVISLGCGSSSRFPDISLGSWIVLRTKSRQEKILSNNLTAGGVGNFLPLVKCIRFYAGRKVTVELPLFPGYLFLRGNLDHAYAADRTRRVAQIIAVHNQEQMERELKALHLALSADSVLNPFPFLKEGVRVEVRAGPLRGLQGKIENASRRDRLILQVQMLGQASSLEIDGSLLDVIDDPMKNVTHPRLIISPFEKWVSPGTC